MYHHIFWLVKGIALGFGISMPVGPMGILCIQRTLRQGLTAGLLTGFGASTADMLYAILAAFGLHFVADFLTQYGHALRIVGGTLLILFGMRILYTADAQKREKNKEGKSLYGLYSSAFLLTFTNPITLFMFTALFAGIGVNDMHVTRFEAAQLIGGVFMGSFSWYVILSLGVSFFHGRIERFLPWINRIAATALICFGIIAFLDGVGIINLPV
ncbi:MAG: LysE family transporter [Candidatus Babeliales bacterium]